MALPNKRIKKIKLPNSNEAYEIIPERLQGDGYEAKLPTLTRDSVLGLQIEIVDLTNINT